MRQRAAESDVVIVNHHLLCADAAVRQNAYGEVIPACTPRDHRRSAPARGHRDAVLRLQRQQLPRRGARARRRAAASQSAASTIAEPRTRSRRRSSGCAITRARSSASWRSPTATSDRPRGEERVRATDDVARPDATSGRRHLTGALDVLEVDAGAARAGRRADDERRTTSRRRPRTPRRWRGAPASCATTCGSCCAADDPTTCTSSSSAARGVFLRAAPIDVSAIVRELLLDRMRTTVLTSATLTVDGALRLHPRPARHRAAPTRCGCRRSSTSREQAILYLPPRMPDPRSPEFAVAAGREVIEILKRTRGPRVRAVHQLRDAARGAGDRGDGARLPDPRAGHRAALAAAQAVPRDAARGAVRHLELLAGRRRRRRGAELRDHRQAAVRLARRSDHGGADRRDPRARRRAVRRVSGAAGDPGAAAGLGRLIRHRSDRGVLAVLDPRLRTKGYGRRFLASLPPAPVVHDLDAVEAFFSIV